MGEETELAKTKSYAIALLCLCRGPQGMICLCSDGSENAELAELAPGMGVVVAAWTPSVRPSHPQLSRSSVRAIYGSPHISVALLGSCRNTVSALLRILLLFFSLEKPVLL